MKIAWQLAVHCEAERRTFRKEVAMAVDFINSAISYVSGAGVGLFLYKQIEYYIMCTSVLHYCKKMTNSHHQ